MQLVVGLGNPGGRYARTRHNVGFMVVDRLAQRWGASVERKQFKALVDTARIGSQSVVLCKPQTYMNLSGDAVVSLRGYYKVEPADVLVVHDDVDLPLGEVRLKRGGGHGGHNGLRDLQGKLGSPGFGRVRVGVSRPPAGWDTADYVLADFRDDEQGLLEDSLDRAADAVEAAVKGGLQTAMQQVNARPGAKDSRTVAVGSADPNSNPSGVQAGPSRS